MISNSLGCRIERADENVHLREIEKRYVTDYVTLDNRGVVRSNRGTNSRGWLGAILIHAYPTLFAEGGARRLITLNPGGGGRSSVSIALPVRLVASTKLDT